MKKTDIALIIIIISMSAGIAYWVASLTIGKSNDKPIVVRTAESINVDEVVVDENVFKKNAINPTVETTISGEDLTSFVDSETPEVQGDGTTDPNTEGSTEGTTETNPGDSNPDQQVDETPVVNPPDTSTSPNGVTPIGG